VTAPVLPGPPATGGGPTPPLDALRAHPRAMTAAPRTYLTAREKETLVLAANGLTNQMIGRALGVSEETVKSRMQVLRRKLRALDRTHAVAVAFALNLIRLDDVQVSPDANCGYRPTA
jgi:DNA-binding NarL/FixJ family response regulator